MKLLAKFSVAVLAFTFALGAFAAEKSLTVYTDSTLNGQIVAAGDYKVDYEINGSNAEVKLLKNKKTVATATGQVVEKETPSDQTAVVRSRNADGSSSIVELDIAKQKSVIRFAPEMTAKGQ